jgi:hypothetical protein
MTSKWNSNNNNNNNNNSNGWGGGFLDDPNGLKSSAGFVPYPGMPYTAPSFNGAYGGIYGGGYGTATRALNGPKPVYNQYDTYEQDEQKDDDDQVEEDAEEEEGKVRSKKPSLRDEFRLSQRDASRDWTQDAIASILKQFKKVAYRFKQKERLYEMEMYFADPTKPSQYFSSNGTFILPYNPSEKDGGVSAEFMFSGMSNDLTDKVHTHLKTVKSTMKAGYCGVYPAEPKSVMIKELEITNVKCSNDKPACLTVTGITNRFITPHKISCNPSVPYTTVLMTTTTPFTFYQAGSDVSPYLEAIHGTDPPLEMITDPKTGQSKPDIIGAWGKAVNNYVLVPKPTGRYIFTVYYLVELLDLWKKKKRSGYPTGISQKCYDDLAEAYTEWKRACYAKKRPAEIYAIGVNLADGYAGKIIDILAAHNTQREEWTMSEEDLYFKVPIAFVEFAAPFYQQTRDNIVMTSPKDIRLRAFYDNPKDNTSMVNENVMFTVRATAFLPQVFWFCKEVSEPEQE